LPLVILQQAAQSFSTPHCSRVPSCLRLQRKQDPIAFALMVALLVIMYGMLLQGSPQRLSTKRFACASEREKGHGDEEGCPPSDRTADN